MQMIDRIRHPDYILMNDWGHFVEKLMEEGRDEYYLVLHYCPIIIPDKVQELLSTYALVEMFELGDCYIGRHHALNTLWHLVKGKQVTTKISILLIGAHSEPDEEYLENPKLTHPHEYNADYVRYLQMLDQWTRTGQQPEDIRRFCEFNTIEPDEFDYCRPFPRFYSKAYNDIRPLIIKSNADMIPLGKIADIFSVSISSDASIDNQVRILDFSNGNLKYPFVIEKDTREYPKTSAATWPPARIPDLSKGETRLPEVSAILHKGDLIVTIDKWPRICCYLLTEEPKSDIYAPPQSSIVRLKDNCPFSAEYVYLYLNSTTFRRIRLACNMPDEKDGHGMQLWGGAETFPIVPPNESDDYYQDQFYYITHPLQRHYTHEQIVEAKDIEGALQNELRQITITTQNNLVSQQVQEDLTELETCFKHGAYKATLIMAGSILEAFLIDWVSDIYHTNYFENRFMVYVFDETGAAVREADGTIKQKPADLVDYINTIKDIFQPDWMTQASNAQFIRQKRNLVHAQLCLREDADINSDLCKEVIQYLKYVIQSRHLPEITSAVFL